MSAQPSLPLPAGPLTVAEIDRWLKLPRHTGPWAAGACSRCRACVDGICQLHACATTPSYACEAFRAVESAT